MTKYCNQSYHFSNHINSQNIVDTICKEARNYVNIYKECKLIEAVEKSATNRQFNNEDLEMQAIMALQPTWYTSKTEHKMRESSYSKQKKQNT